MHTHFYEEQEEVASQILADEGPEAAAGAGFWFMENESVAGKINAYDLLHGRCDAFARYMAEKYGLAAEAILDEEMNLVHAYCTKTTPDGRRAFLDARGWTDDYGEFLEEFADWLDVPPCGAGRPAPAAVPFDPGRFALPYGGAYYDAAERLDEDYRYMDAWLPGSRFLGGDGRDAVPWDSWKERRNKI